MVKDARVQHTMNEPFPQDARSRSSAKTQPAASGPDKAQPPALQAEAATGACHLDPAASRKRDGRVGSRAPEPTWTSLGPALPPPPAEWQGGPPRYHHHQPPPSRLSTLSGEPWVGVVEGMPTAAGGGVAGGGGDDGRGGEGLGGAFKRRRLEEVPTEQRVAIRPELDSTLRALERDHRAVVGRIGELVIAGERLLERWPRASY